MSREIKTKSILEKIISNGKNFLLGAALVSGIAISSQAQQPVINSISINNPSTGALTNQGYHVQTNPSIPTEKRAYFNGHHFLSILTDNGIFALRPHPGLDVDGWGSTLYLQPFLSGATLGHTLSVQCNVVTNSGIPNLQIIANGEVSKGVNEKYGTWSSRLDIAYNPNNKKMNAAGEYGINLPGKFEGMGDLNFWKLASNFLKNVPLNYGTIGNTGDMKEVIYKGDGMWQHEMQNFRWDPATSNGGDFPWHLNSYLEVKVVGDENIVDSARQGYQAILPASKPSVSVNMQATNPSMKVSFGTYYNNNQSSYFWADNIAVTPWIRSAEAVTNYLFNIAIDSSAISNDSYSSNVSLTATDSTKPAYMGVYSASSITNQFYRIGSIKGSGENFTGKFKVNEPQAFFSIKRE